MILMPRFGRSGAPVRSRLFIDFLVHRALTTELLIPIKADGLHLFLFFHRAMNVFFTGLFMFLGVVGHVFGGGRPWKPSGRYNLVILGLWKALFRGSWKGFRRSFMLSCCERCENKEQT